METNKKEINIRPNWDEYFLEIMRTVGKRATCDRGRSGAIIVKDKQILTTGYVGAPAGLDHCDEVGHLFENRLNADGTTTTHCIRTTHAEQNAIVQAAKHGISINGATIYCTMVPCRDCTKSIISVGIKRVVAEKMYQKGDLSIEWFKQAGVKLDIISKEVQQYPNELNGICMRCLKIKQRLHAEFCDDCIKQIIEYQK